ncbi:hypothetical protein ADUPG1_010985 [Aduncisulcus paluster]|uniref:Uncharacterized protein n=1 Tax=Aduncisulcus paluster TaxID=2918883 RepID=A0ABQ5JX68_9EUKA|nr:hypothetical protein ADUPG1_010985 [Aduncisulcus paluster]
MSDKIKTEAEKYLTELKGARCYKVQSYTYSHPDSTSKPQKEGDKDDETKQKHSLEEDAQQYIDAISDFDRTTLQNKLFFELYYKALASGKRTPEQAIKFIIKQCSPKLKKSGEKDEESSAEEDDIIDRVDPFLDDTPPEPIKKIFQSVSEETVLASRGIIEFYKQGLEFGEEPEKIPKEKGESSEDKEKIDAELEETHKQLLLELGLKDGEMTQEKCLAELDEMLKQIHKNLSS